MSTGENVQKWTRYFLLLFPTRPSNEYDSAPSRKYSRPLLDVFACINNICINNMFFPIIYKTSFYLRIEIPSWNLKIMNNISYTHRYMGLRFVKIRTLKNIVKIWKIKKFKLSKNWIWLRNVRAKTFSFFAMKVGLFWQGYNRCIHPKLVPLLNLKIQIG